MTRPNGIGIQGSRLRIDNRVVPLLSGEVQFFRLDRGDWDSTLRAVAGEGIPIVATYLSWRRHVPDPEAPPIFEQDERLDVKVFLRLCAEHGLLVHLKPGPWICAEEPGGGYPDWLLADSGLWALDSTGAPVSGYNPPFKHPVPSYLHPRYLAHGRRWIAQVDEYLREFFHPHGPIALVQLDNEPSYCFQASMYGFDYHPVMLETFARWTLRRYRSLAAISRAWGLPLSSVGHINPPRLQDESALGAAAPATRREEDWIRFHEWVIAEHLRRLRTWHERSGVRSVFFTVNYNQHAVHTVPQEPRTIHRMVRTLGGDDFYHEPPLRQENLLELARRAAVMRAHSEPLPWAPEIMTGIWRSPGEVVDYPDPTPDEQALHFASALAFGLKGLNFYMLVDRENWELAPLHPDGRATPMVCAVRWAVALARTLLDGTPLEPVSPVALMWHRPYARDAYSSTTASYAADADFSAPRARPYRATLDAFAALAARSHLPQIWDTQLAVPADAEAIVAPVGDYLAPGLQRHLVAMARRGVPVVLVGEPPRFGAPGRACARLRAALERAHSDLVVARDPREALARLDALGVEPPVRCDDGETLCVMQEGGARRVLFLLRTGRAPATVEVAFRDVEIASLRPLPGLDSPSIPVWAGAAVVPLGATSAAVFDVVE